MRDRQKKGFEDAIKNEAGKVVTKTRFRLGELTKEMPKSVGAAGNPGGQGAPIVQSQGVTTQTYAQLGLNKMEVSRAKTLASVTEDELDIILEVVESKGEVTQAAVLREISNLHRSAASAEKVAPELAEIDENLRRNELTQLEQGQHLARRKEIYEALYPETKQHVSGGKARQGTATDTMSFAESTGTAIGASDRTVRRSIQIATNISADVQDTLASTKTADCQKDLLSLSRMDAAEQKAVADKIVSGKAKTVKDAKKQIAQETKATPVFIEPGSGRLSGRFPTRESTRARVREAMRGRISGSQKE